MILRNISSRPKFFPFLLTGVLLTSTILSGCTLPVKNASASVEAAQLSSPISRTELQLDTVITLSLYDSSDETLLTNAFDLCRKYELIFSRTNTESELYKLNHRLLPLESGTSDSYKVSPELAELISIGLTYSQASDGAFNVAMAPLTSIWDFTSADPVVPDASEIEKAITRLDYESVTVEDRIVTLPNPQTMFDLGALAKGYIADRLKDYLVSEGVQSAILSLGGNILCIGEKAENTPFTVGIQKPFGAQGEYLMTLKDNDLSIVTSGNYQRCFTQDGVFYHHILNPKTGYSYDNDLTSVTILSEKSVDGDALSTTCYALGLEGGLKFLSEIPDTYGIFLTSDGTLVTSEDLPESFELTVIQ